MVSPRQRGIWHRMVRETDPPTGSLPRLTKSSQLERDSRINEVLDLAGNIGAILMASGMPAVSTIEQVTANPKLHTGDLGGKATTVQVTQAVCELLTASAQRKAA